MPKQITLTLSELVNKLVSKYKDMTSGDRDTFLRSAPYDLSELFNMFGIKSYVNSEQLEKLIQHTGIAGAPREYFLITIDGIQVELLLSEIVELSTKEKLLKNFVQNYSGITDSIKEIRDSRIDESAIEHTGKAGDIFYSDISLKLDSDYKNSPSKSIIYSLTCGFLRGSNIHVHS